MLSGGFAVRNAKKSVEALSGLRGNSVANAMSGVATASSKFHNDGRSNNLTGHGNGTDIGTFAEEATVSNRGKDLAKAEMVCGINSVECFVAGTKIQTADGEKNIEDIKAGDVVYAYDTESGEKGLKTVQKTFVHNVTELIHVTVNGELIHTTPNHPFYVEGAGFKRADELKVGDRVRLLNGEIKKVDRLEAESLKHPVKVFNFRVADWHDYYVGTQGVLVHNAESLIASIQEGNETAELKYDDTGRIVEKKDGEGTIRYSYDKNGNVLTVSETKGQVALIHDQKTLSRVSMAL